MNLLKKARKVKNFLIPRILFPAMLLLNGCATGPQITGHSWSPTYRTREERGSRTKEEIAGYEYSYRFDNPEQLEDIFEVEVKENVNEIRALSREMIKKQEYAEYESGYTKEQSKDANEFGCFLIALGIAGMLGGAIKASSGEKKDTESGKKIALAGVGLDILGLMRLGTKDKREYYHNPTGRTKYEAADSFYVPVSRNRVNSVENAPAREIPMRLSSDFFRFEDKDKIFTASTDNKGKIRVKLTEHSPYWAFTQNGLEKEIQNSLAECIMPDYLDAFVKDAIAFAEKTTRPLNLATLVDPAHSKDVANAKGTASLNGFEIDPVVYRKILKTWVDKHINSKIDNAEIITRDKLSHLKIPVCLVELEIKTPSPEELVKFYFKGDFVNLAASEVKSYAYGKLEITTDSLGRAKFPVYLGSKAEFEVTRKDYHFFNGKHEFDRGKMEYLVDMIDAGSKVRVRAVHE